MGDSDDIQDLVDDYEQSKEQGSISYFDSDDYADIAEYYLDVGELDNALEAINDALHLHGDEDFLWTIKVNVLISMRRYDEAVPIIDRLDPEEEPDVYYFRGQLCCGVDHDYDKANEWFDRWMEIETQECAQERHEGEGHKRLREAYLHVILSIVDLGGRKGKREAVELWSRRYLKACVPLAADDIDLDIVKTLHELRLYELEIGAYSEILNTDPYIHNGWTYLSSLYLMLDKLPEAVNAVDFALAINPDDDTALNVKGHALEKMGNHTDAARTLRHCIQLNDDEKLYALLGRVLVQTDEREEGYQYLTRADNYYANELTDPSTEASRRLFLAESFLLGKYTHEAMHQITLGLKAVPDHVELLVLKGNVYMAEDDVKGATDAYMDALRVAKKTFPVLMSAGIQLARYEYYVNALFFFHQAMKQTDDPDHVVTYVYIARICLTLGEWDSFYTYLELACRYTPNIVGAWWADELIGVAEEDYFDTLKTIYQSKFPGK